MPDYNLPHNENIIKFTTIITNNLLNLNDFMFASYFNDYFLEGYEIKPHFNEGNVIQYKWVESSYFIINVKSIRLFLLNEFFNSMSELQHQCLADAHLLEPTSEEYEKTQKKVKKIAEICKGLQNGHYYFKLLEYLPQF